MYSLTIHNMDAAVYSQLYAIAEQEDLSLNQVVKRLLRDALDALTLPKTRKTDFGEFAGKWSRQEEAAFNARVARTIDAEDWR